MWVVKLGGSLAGEAVLRDWLEMLAGYGGGQVVIVPGGGPFADQVREAQDGWRFDDGTAHRMALLAMEQYGLMLTGICPELVPADSRQELLGALRAGRVAVWLPTKMALAADEIPHSWDVTSDSLAAWLANHVSAERLVLVKPFAPAQLEIEAEEMSRRGMVDRAFPAFVRSGCFQTLVLGKQQHPALKRLLLGSVCRPIEPGFFVPRTR
ncbi:MAG: hypothetical protein DI596_04700 [Azospira oryzae]|nr:MAG: hypothetical protein DI596_04700 [Azospira oryzae]PZP81195.1 MAG: hypothetical protein DI593_04700 [Azospira oryzae]